MVAPTPSERVLLHERLRPRWLAGFRGSPGGGGSVGLVDQIFSPAGLLSGIDLTVVLLLGLDRGGVVKPCGRAWRR